MLFRLALSLGRTVAELESTMSSSEFEEWCEYYTMEPFGAWRDNYHAAQLCALTYNVHRGKQQPAKLADFFYIDQETKSDAKAAEFFARLDSLGAKKNG